MEDRLSQTFPKEMLLSMVHSPQRFKLMWIPETPCDDIEAHVSVKEQMRAPCASPEHLATAEPQLNAPCESEKIPTTEEVPEIIPVVDGPVTQPLLDLCFVNCFSGAYVNVLLWIPNSDEVIFAASSLLISINGAVLITPPH